MIRAFIIMAFAYAVISLLTATVLIGIGLLRHPHDDDGWQG